MQAARVFLPLRRAAPEHQRFSLQEQNIARRDFSNNQLGANVVQHQLQLSGPGYNLDV